MTTRPGFSFCICPDGKLLRQQVEELLGAHPDAGRERHVFWGDDELPPKFWEILTLQGLFSTSRVLVMRNAQALTADVWKRLSAALSRPNPQTWPLFCLEVAWEKGQPKIPAHIAKLPCFTFADAKGWIWRSPGLEPRSLRRHIQIRSKALGLDLEPGCVDILAETLLPDAAAVDAEVKRIMDECYARAQKILSDHRDRLEAVVAALLERETLSRTDFVTIMEGGELPPMTEAERLRPKEDGTADAQSAAPQETKENGEGGRSAHGRALPYFGRDVHEGEAFWEPKE